MTTARTLPRRAAFVPALAITTILLVPATSDARTTLTLRGGERDTVTMCGTERAATVASNGTKVLARGRVDGKRAKRSAVATVARCVDGEWDTISRTRMRSQRRMPAGSDADMRITWRGRSVFLRQGQGGIARVPISFRVRNVNGTVVPCPGDGKTYVVRGNVTAPAAALEPGGTKTTTLYNHGHSFDERLWTYGGVDGYDFSNELAERGHTSVTYDRLGYGKSDKLHGFKSCYQTEATVISQMIAKLKNGDYDLEGRDELRFGRVALAGISQGALINEGVANTFKNQDALIHLGFVPAAFITPPIAAKFAAQQAQCAANSEPAVQQEGNPRGYAFRGRTDAEFRETNFVNTDPKVVADFTARRFVDPCGLPVFVTPWIGYVAANDNQVRGPVLVVFGAQDANFLTHRQAVDAQTALFSGTADRTTELLADTGHMLPLERTAPQLQRIVSDWLKQRGF